MYPCTVNPIGYLLTNTNFIFIFFHMELTWRSKYGVVLICCWWWFLTRISIKALKRGLRWVWLGWWRHREGKERSFINGGLFIPYSDRGCGRQVVLQILKGSMASHLSKSSHLLSPPQNDTLIAPLSTMIWIHITCVYGLISCWVDKILNSADIDIFSNSINW